jgi:hypothetical protein
MKRTILIALIFPTKVTKLIIIADIIRSPLKLNAFKLYPKLEKREISTSSSLVLNLKKEKKKVTKVETKLHDSSLSTCKSH